jgi:hypothetical protein
MRITTAKKERVNQLGNKGDDKTNSCNNRATTSRATPKRQPTSDLGRLGIMSREGTLSLPHRIGRATLLVMFRCLFTLIFFIVACQNPTLPTINDKNCFFNAGLVDAILDVEEAQRSEFLMQYTNKEIVGRGKVISVHETLANEETASYGKLEALTIDENVARNVNVEYRVYINEAEGKELRHKTVSIAFTGTVKHTQWVKEGSIRVLRVYVVASKIELKN